jgi:hypothetical protein
MQIHVLHTIGLKMHSKWETPELPFKQGVCRLAGWLACMPLSSVPAHLSMIDLTATL